MVKASTLHPRFIHLNCRCVYVYTTLACMSTTLWTWSLIMIWNRLTSEIFWNNVCVFVECSCARLCVNVCVYARVRGRARVLEIKGFTLIFLSLEWCFHFIAFILNSVCLPPPLSLTSVICRDVMRNVSYFFRTVCLKFFHLFFLFS